uniref:Uncharacterized protein n=1 Tax=Moniliophthora roreri TaxID=221103 RepID=A0A0W0FBL7_MONRR
MHVNATDVLLAKTGGSVEGGFNYSQRQHK